MQADSFYTVADIVLCTNQPTFLDDLNEKVCYHIICSQKRFYITHVPLRIHEKADMVEHFLSD
jgi:hypothetical protein